MSRLQSLDDDYVIRDQNGNTVFYVDRSTGYVRIGTGSGAPSSGLESQIVFSSLGLRVGASRIIEKLTNTDVDAQNNTLTAAQILAGIITHTSVTGGGTVTTDTALLIIAGCGLTANGDSIRCLYVNDGDQTLTLAGGTDVTISDTGQTIATNEAAYLQFVRLTSTTVLCVVVGA